MKTKLILIVALCLVQVTIAQNYQTVEDVNDACASLRFSANEDAEIAVERILDIIGLPKNFTLQECPNINNAVAKNIKNSSGQFIRYILYDNEFFESMDSRAATNWAAISVLAHEIGHHLSGHALNNLGSNHKFELEADYFSGMILAKMGATLVEAQSAIQLLRYTKATSTHPAKIDRLNEIKKGWSKGKGNNNTNVNEDVDPIVDFYLENAKKGDAYAQSYLGYLYDSGTEIPQDYKKALYWYRKAADQDDSYAQYNLGTMYYHGKGMVKDYYTAALWYTKASVLGDVKAQYFLATMFYEGMEGLAKDVDGALYWFIKAAEQNYPDAQYYLAGMYFDGIGVKQNVYTAFTWYSKAANQNHAGAQSFLGYMYETGSGVTKNYNTAVSWYQKSARQGNKYSQDNLNRLGESW